MSLVSDVTGVADVSVEQTSAAETAQSACECMREDAFSPNLPARNDATRSQISLPEIELVSAPVPQLEDEALQTKLPFLRQAIKDGDIDEIKRLLEPLASADRERLEELYNQQRDDKKNQNWNLRNDLIKELNDGKSPDAELKAKYVEVVGILSREGDRTNDAAQLQEVISRKSEIEVLETLATLNPDQIEQLDADYRNQFGIGFKEALKEASLLSPEARQFIEILSKGLDPETRKTEDIIQLAKIAAEKQNVDFLAIALRGDIADEARERLKTDSEFQQLLQKPINGLPPESGNQFGNSRVVMDILSEGHISLATIVDKNNHRGFSPLGLFGSDNKANVDLAIAYATEDEKQKFKTGRDLELADRTSNLTPFEQEALDYYKRLHKQLDDLGNESEVVKWEQVMLSGIPDHDLDLIGDLAEQHRDHDDFFSVIDNLSEEDWLKLKDSTLGPQLREQLVRSLDEYASDKDRDRVLNILDRKLAVGTYQEASDIRRSIEDVLKDTKSDDDLVKAVFSMSAEDRQRYHQDGEFRNWLVKEIEKHTNGKDEALIKSLLSQIEQTGNKPKLSPVDQVLWDNVFKAEPGLVLMHAEIALQDPAFRERIRKGDGLSFQEKEFKQVVEEAVTQGLLDHEGFAAANFGRDQLLDVLFKEGKLPLDWKLSVGVPKQYVYENLHGASTDELQRVREKLHDEERAIFDVVVSNPDGKLQLEDRIRSYVLKDGSSYTDFDQALRALTPEQLQALKQQYAHKYHSDLDNDLLDRIKQENGKVVQKYLHLLNPSGPGDGRQDYYDNLQDQEHSLSGSVPDGTELTLIRSSQLYAEALQDFQQRYELLPAEKREELDRLFQEAIEAYQQSKEAYAERLLTIITIVAGVGLAVATGGVTAAALPYFFIAGAALRVGVKAAVEGNDFDLSLGNVLREGFTGGVTFALSVTGPETLASLGAVGKVAAGRVLTEAAEQGIRGAFKEGAENILERRINDMVSRSFLRGQQISDEQIVSLARQVVNSGASEETVLKVSHSIRRTINASGQDVAETLLTPERLVAGGREVVGFGVFSGTTGAASELIVAPVNGGISGDRLKQAFVSGAFAASGFSILFKTAGTGLGALHGQVRTVPDGIEIEVNESRDISFTVRRADGNIQEVVVRDGDSLHLGPKDELTHVDGKAIEGLQADPAPRISTDLPDDIAAIIEAAGRPYQFPPGITTPIDLGDGTVATIWQHGTIVQTPDGRTILTNDQLLTSRTFDQQGRLIEESNGAFDPPRVQRYEYDDSGDLVAINTDQTTTIKKNGKWFDVSTSDHGEQTLRPSSRFNSDRVIVNPEGGTIELTERGISFNSLSTSWDYLDIPSGRRTSIVSYDYELELAKRSVDSVLPDNEVPGAIDFLNGLSGRFLYSADVAGGPLLNEFNKLARENPSAAAELFNQIKSTVEGVGTLDKVRIARDTTGKPVISFERSLSDVSVERISTDGTRQQVLFTPNRVERQMTYAADGSFQAAQSNFPGGSAKLSREGDGWVYRLELTDGSVQLINLGRSDLTANDAGQITLKSESSSVDAAISNPDGSIELQYRDGTVETLNTQGITKITAANFEDQVSRLNQNLDSYIPNPELRQTLHETFSANPGTALESVPPEQRAVLLAELNRLVGLNPDKAIAAIQQIDVALKSHPIDTITVSRYRGEAYIELSSPNAKDQGAVRIRIGSDGIASLSSLPPELVAGYHESDGLWQASRDFTSLFTPAQVTELTAHLPEVYRVADPAALSNFSRRAQDLIVGWKSSASELGQDTAAQSDQIVEQRLADVQGLLDQTADELGLPRVKVNAKESLPINVAGNYDGNINLSRQDLLTVNNPADLINTIYHEFAHHEQNTLVIRRIADELQIDQVATPEQLRELENRVYAFRPKLPPGLLEDTLRLRDGERLTAAQSVAVDQLRESFISSYGKFEIFVNAADDYRLLSSGISELRSADGITATHEWLRSLAGDNTRKWFGVVESGNTTYGALSPDLSNRLSVLQRSYRDAAAAGRPFTDAEIEEAGDLLIDITRFRLQQINELRRSEFSRYASNQVEWDAWIIGDLTKTHVDRDQLGSYDPAIQQIYALQQ